MEGSQIRSGVDVVVRGTGLGRDFSGACIRQADKSRLDGTMRHDPESESWLIYLEGMPHQIDDFLAWIRDGDHAFEIARVDTVRVVDVQGVHGFHASVI